MGVTGLWRVLEPAGRHAPLDALRGKVLAVDISIWLHQMVKGYQDASGRAVANAHLLGLFQRLCKLLYYGIKPVFVFDGSIPILKRNTIQNRQTRRSHMKNDADKIQQQLLNIITKNAAVNSLIPNNISPTRKSPVKSVTTGDEDLFKLPDLKAGALESSSSDSEDESTTQKTSTSKYQNIDLHGINVHSDDFKKLSARERHDILTEMKETRKLNSWGRIHELPAQSDNFSDYQMKRLLKRRQVQVSLEEAEKEIGGHFLSINELEILLNEEGISTKIENIRTRQITSDENAHYLLIKDVKKAMSDAIQHENSKVTSEKCVAVDAEAPSTSGVVNNVSYDDELERDIKKAIALSLECSDDKTEIVTEVEDNVNWNLIKEESFNDSDDDEPIYNANVNNLAMARGYMMEFSGLTENEINQIINNETTNTKKINKPQSIEKIILNSSPILPIDKDVIETVPDDKRDIRSLDSSSTDSDDSFEEVPEINNVDNDTSNNDDIFADIFADGSKFEMLDKAMITTLEKNMPHLKNTSAENDNVNSTDLTEDSENKINLNTDHDFDTNKDLVINDDVTIIPDSPKNFEKNASPDRSNIDSDSNLERSPRKGIRLNDIKQLVSNIDREDTSAETDKTFSIEMIAAMSEDLDNQRSILEKEKNKLDRMGRNISDEMTNDAQELLKLFGIPFIIAPTEAESQCAYLESIKLTDGTITDDSDIWLFGGKTVYRNFFNQQKQVLQFLAENIKKSFKLQREDFILLALLVGSDYTMGVSGIGPVTALEILSAFPSNKNDVIPPYTNLLNGLKRFRTWWSTKQAFTHTSLRNKLKNISLSEEFPNHKVVEAYLLPDVDKSKEIFSWGKFDICGLREFTKEKFGWTRAKTEDILNPILKRMDLKISQLSIRSFFNTEFKQDVTIEKMSKRVKKAIENMDADENKLEDDTADQIESIKGKRGRQPKKKSDSATSKNPVKRKKAQTNKEQAINVNDVLSVEIENPNTEVNQAVENTADAIESNEIKGKRQSKKKNPDNTPKTRAKRKKTSTVEVAENNDHELLLHISSHCTDQDTLGENSLSPFMRSKEVIPQRENDKGIFLKNKLKAIELFRTSKKGPGFVKRRKKQIIQPKEDAELSESSSD